MTRAALAIVFLALDFVPRAAGDGECRGQRSPQESINLRSWNLTDGPDLFAMMEGHWYMLSTINWFETGWKCFEGTFMLNSTDHRLTCEWSFDVPLLGTQHMTDRLSFPEPAKIDQLSLESLSIPQWARKFMDEAHRAVRLLGVSQPGSTRLEWVVLFDCGNWETPNGELFVLSRSPSLDSSVMLAVRDLVKANGISDFQLLPTCEGDAFPRENGAGVIV